MLLRVTPPTELEPVAKVVMVPFCATILLNSNLTPPTELDPVPATMTPAVLPFAATFSVVPSHVSPEFALIVPGLPDVVIR